MLMQVARQEAAANPPRAGAQRTGVAPGGLRRSGSAGDLRRNPLRRSALSMAPTLGDAPTAPALRAFWVGYR